VKIKVGVSDDLEGDIKIINFLKSGINRVTLRADCYFRISRHIRLECHENKDHQCPDEKSEFCPFVWYVDILESLGVFDE
jgi:hypothetical protein